MAEEAKAMISQGALDAIFNDPEKLEREFPVPILQCVQVKVLAANGGDTPERYRLVLSDVKNFVQSMLSTQANSVVHEGKLKKGSIVRLKSYQANSVKGKKILIIVDLDVIDDFGELEKLGEPVALAVKEDENAKPVNTTIAGSGFYGTSNADSKPIKQDPAPERALPSRTGPSSSSHGNIYPIEGLSPYAHKWTIKARVSHKSDIKTWHKSNSEGKLFSVNFLDESGEIKATGFNAECDAFYDMLQEGSVYYITAPCRVQLAKKQFSNLTNDYEMTFERDTLIEKAEDQENVPQVRYNFTSIEQLQEVEKDSTVDVIAILKEVAEVDTIVSKSTQKPYEKRELTLVDDSGYSVKLTIWGKTANSFDANPEAVVAFKGVKVSDFGGRSLSLLSSGSMAIDPDTPDAHRIKGWYDSQGRTNNFITHTNTGGAGIAGGRRDETKTLAAVQEANLGMNEAPDYFTNKGTLLFIKQEPFSYPACMSEGCSKKVVDNNDGTWHCAKCDINHPRPEHRYILSLNVSDHTGHLWMTCFDDIGRLIMNMSADDLMHLKDNDSVAMERAFEAANCKTYLFKVRAKMDSFQDQQRVRYQITGGSKVDFAVEAHKLADLIKLYNID